MRGRRLLALTAIGLAPVLASCEIETLILPPPPPLLQVHAILQVGQSVQRIHVERVLVGEGTTNRGGVVPVTNAVVTVTTPSGAVLTGRLVLDSTDGGSGSLPLPLSSTARYEVTTSFPNTVSPGGTYRLRVATPEGLVVSGTTQVPNQTQFASTVNRTISRDRDTMLVTWRTPAFTAASWVRVEGIGTSFNQFVSGDTVRLAGGLQSMEFDEVRSHVFVPGHLTPITVAAVDQNVYDYFRSGSDPFTGQGRINHLQGGFGVFGSVGIVARISADVVAEIRDSLVEGRWTVLGTALTGQKRVIDLRLYLDRELHVPDDEPERPLYGSWIPGDGTVLTSRPIVTGTRTGNEVRLNLLRSNQSFDEVIGRLSGDTLYATYLSDGATATFIRR